MIELHRHHNIVFNCQHFFPSSGPPNVWSFGGWQMCPSNVCASMHRETAKAICLSFVFGVELGGLPILILQKAGFESGFGRGDAGPATSSC